MKKHELTNKEIAYILTILNFNLEFAPEENTQFEIDITESINKKLIGGADR